MIVLPRIGQMLRISIVSLDEKISKQIYKSRVADIQGDELALELPISEETGRTKLIPQGSKIEVTYYSEDGSSYHFQTSVTGERKDAAIRVLLIRMPEKDTIIRTQRRNYLRVDMHAEVAIKSLDSGRSYHFLARTTDLSGGGLAFTCKEQFVFKPEDKLHIWMVLQNKAGQVSHAFAEAEVTRVKAPEEKGTHQWVSVKFTQISQADQAKVIRTCYERQLELKKKGIGE